MQGAEKLGPISLEEFETMEKNEKLRYELIDGVIMMSPRPTMKHQDINFNSPKPLTSF